MAEPLSRGHQSPSAIPVHRREGEEERAQGTGLQELCTLGPGDLLWEYESALQWALVISRIGHQGQLEHTGRLRLRPTVEDRHRVPIPLRTNTKAAVRKTCQPREGSQTGKG